MSGQVIGVSEVVPGESPTYPRGTHRLTRRTATWWCPSSAGTLMVLTGRRRERGYLNDLIEGVRSGHSAAVVLHSDAGVGKTALLEDLIQSATNFRVARAVGVESEMELAFAMLQQLVAPMLSHLERLPAPQSDALATVFGRKSGPPDSLLAGLALLSLLSDAAEEHPLVCVVDDAQWIDHTSAVALGVAARRLMAESVLLVIAARESNDDFIGLPELVVEGLPDPDARELLDSAISWPLDDRVPRADPERSAGKSAGPVGTAARTLSGGAGGWIRVARHPAACRDGSRTASSGESNVSPTTPDCC